MHIRQLTIDDWQAWKYLRLLALADIPEAFGSSYEEELLWSDEQFIQNLKNNIIFGAFVQSKMVGTAAFFKMNLIKTKHKGVIWGMYIQQEYREKGFASELLKVIVAHANSQVAQLQLTVVTTNIAGIHLYQKFGFQIYGTEHRALKINDRFYDEYLMYKELS